MNEILITILGGMILGIAIIQYLTIKYLKQKNDELQEQFEILSVMYDSVKVKLKRKKELLEMQDKLLKESK